MKNHVLSLQQPEPPEFNVIQKWLAGREIRAEDWLYNSEDVQCYLEDGIVERIPGLIQSNGRNQCVRCGNMHPELFGSYHCSRCEKSCDYCRSCLMIGVVKACTHLLRWKGPDPVMTQTPDPLCAWQGELTPHQQTASDFVQSQLHQKEDGLIWAVCGAGKTEILFRGIESQIKSGKKVALATPRTDVVLELYPRFKKAFPKLAICAQYGGGPEFDPYAPLVITTTHQLLRFYQAFDAIIIDEVDAFPFSHDPKLLFAVNKAVKPHAPKLYLTATPDVKLKKKFLSNQLKGVKIPARFHGHPLPVPKLKWLGAWEDVHLKKKLPRAFAKWLEERTALKHPLFVFVPRISMLPFLQNLLMKETELKVDAVHAEDPARIEKVQQFREGELNVLLTTTILERGITISRADVAVFGADDRVFDERALVQIAGRAGRDEKVPTGDVIFFHHGRTEEMIRSVRHIQAMNREGGFK